MIALSVILPVYNDAQALAAFLPELGALLASQPGRQEIVVVNDGSRDNVQAVCQAAGLPGNTVLRLIALSRNFGKEAALSAGLAAARGQAVAMMDADGQHPVAVLAQMLALLRQDGADMVAAVQAERPHESALTSFLKRSFYAFMQDGRHRYELKPNAGDFRLLKRKVVDALLALPERQRFMKGLYAWVGFNTLYLPFTAQARVSGQSTFSHASLFELALVGITSFSHKPLRWISRMGMAVSLASMLYGAYIVLDTLLFGRDVPGWATVAAGVMFSAGLQLICLGVMGEYVGRIYEEVKQRPLFIIDSEWRSDAPAAQNPGTAASAHARAPAAAPPAMPAAPAIANTGPGPNA